MMGAAFFAKLSFFGGAEHNEVNLNAGGRHTLKIEGIAPYSRI